MTTFFRSCFCGFLSWGTETSEERCFSWKIFQPADLFPSTGATRLKNWFSKCEPRDSVNVPCSAVPDWTENGITSVPASLSHILPLPRKQWEKTHSSKRQVFSLIDVTKKRMLKNKTPSFVNPSVHFWNIGRIQLEHIFSRSSSRGTISQGQKVCRGCSDETVEAPSICREIATEKPPLSETYQIWLRLSRWAPEKPIISVGRKKKQLLTPQKCSWWTLRGVSDIDPIF